MASIVYRLTNLFAILGIVLTGFGLGLRIITNSQHCNGTTGIELNITCIADGPTYLNQTILTMEITREDQYKPITTIIRNENQTVSPQTKDNMEADGHIDFISSNSYLTLIINKPGVEECGLYTCHMFVLGEHHVTIKKTVTTQVNFEDHYQFSSQVIDTDLNSIVEVTTSAQNNHFEGIIFIEEAKHKELITKTEIKNIQERTMANISALITTSTDVQKQLKKQNASIHRLKEKITEICKWINLRRACPYEWTYYNADKTCLRVFGIDNSRDYLGWFKARDACEEHGGSLVQIRDKAKNKFVYRMFSRLGKYSTWIGIENKNRSGFDFKYVDGTDLKTTFQPWKNGEPDGDEDDDEKCVALYTSKSHFPKKWSDYNCFSRKPYVCSIHLCDII